MNRKTSRAKAKVAGAALVLTLLAPAAARGMSTGDQGLARVARHVVSDATAVSVARSTGAAALHGFEYSARPAVEQQPAATPSQGRGLGRREAAIGAGIFIGLLLFGLWGYVPVGAVIVGVAALFGAGATLGRRIRHAAPSSTRRASAAAPSSSTSSA